MLVIVPDLPGTSTSSPFGTPAWQVVSERCGSPPRWLK
jgi:hypothetical protein